MSVAPQTSFLHTSCSVTSLQRPCQHPSGKLTAIIPLLLSEDQCSFTNLQITIHSEITSVRGMASKEALAKQVCLGAVPEFHPDSGFVLFHRKRPFGKEWLGYTGNVH